MASKTKLAPIVRGDTLRYKIVVTNPDGKTHPDIGGTLIIFTLKTNATDLDPGVLQVKYTVPSGITGGINAANGEAVLTVGSTATDALALGSYFYDFQWVISSIPPVVTTIQYGMVPVITDITRSTS
jgi:hypothetical protein